MKDELTASAPRDAASVLTALALDRRQPQAGAIRKRVMPLLPIMRMLGFFGLIALVAVGLDHAFTLGLRRIKTSEFGSSNAIISGRINAQIVISGSSRALVHYDPRIFQEHTGKTAYNLGRNGAQTDMQWAFLQAYLAHNVKPQFLIHNLDPYSFVLTREIFDPGQYVPYLNEDAIYDALRSINPSAWKWKYVPLYALTVEDMRFTWVMAAKGLIGINPPQDYFLGYNPRDMKWTGEFDRYKASVPTGVNVEIDPRAVQLLQELVRTCQNRGIQVILIFAPEFMEMQSLTLNRAEIFGQFRQIAEKFHVPFWDYSESPLCQDRDLFYNSQHMNRRGASLFSADVARRLAAMTDQAARRPERVLNLSPVPASPWNSAQSGDAIFNRVQNMDN